MFAPSRLLSTDVCRVTSTLQQSPARGLLSLGQAEGLSAAHGGARHVRADRLLEPLSPHILGGCGVRGGPGGAPLAPHTAMGAPSAVQEQPAARQGFPEVVWGGARCCLLTSLGGEGPAVAVLTVASWKACEGAASGSRGTALRAESLASSPHRCREWRCAANPVDKAAALASLRGAHVRSSGAVTQTPSSFD